jgi:energy-coupling factor transporter ATP-binding protein EcfA2
MDFYRIRVNETKDGRFELYPDFKIGRSKDLMVQGKTFYAIWDEENGLWSRDEYDVQRLVDEDLQREADKLKSQTGLNYSIKWMSSFNSNSWKQFRKYLQHVSDNYHQLDSKLIFQDTEVKKSDFATRRLPYPLEGSNCAAWDELVGVLYNEAERAKIEWAIGSIVAGDSKKIQKFLVFYGPAGSGKSTILNIIEKLFEGYTTTFDGKALGSSSSQFATEAFKHNPLVAIQHDGDLSRIEDNTRLNSIISHEYMMMNEKYKPSYTSRVDALLFLGSNQPVKISDAKSGIIRRLIDIHPTGVKIPIRHYHTLMSQIEFELGAIAHQCLQVYLSMGKNYYNGYRPLEMMFQTDIFFNFIEAHYDIFKGQNSTTLKQAYALYKEFCSESGIDKPLPQYKLREELRNYFDEFKDRGEIDGVAVRSLYLGFSAEKFKTPVSKDDPLAFSLVIDEQDSLLDEVWKNQPAQLASKSGTMYKKWEDVTSTLGDIDTSLLHWVRVPENHIVIDFDLKDINGHKAIERNLEAASLWPATYAELSKSGSGVHLHYEFEGDTSELSSSYADGIEIKVFAGDASLRRRLSRCNAVSISKLSSGLPKKSKKEKMLTDKTIKSEKGLRELIERNLRKEIHPGTKPSVDFIKKVLDDAYESGMKYDVTDMRSKILAFANNSTNQGSLAIKVVGKMKFASKEEVEADAVVPVTDDRIVLFDVEVYPNLFVICWKFRGDDTVVRMINPSAHDVEALFKLKLTGFYNRRYDNHILYAASMGYTTEKLFKLSQKIIVDNNNNAKFAAAYNLSYADIWDFSSKKQGLKRFEIDLGIHHMELDLPWDQPVDPEDWEKVVEYCVNDVRATEAVLEDRWQDFVARQILAELSGLTVNDTTQKHTAQIIFGNDKDPQKQFVYTDLSTLFPGYKFEQGKSTYRGEDPGEGGYVYAEPGIYQNVALLDVASMHPTSMELLGVFGPVYTARFAALTEARVAIKHQEYEVARSLFDGKLRQFLVDAESNPAGGEALAYALKIAINIVYGLTSAKFDNPFRDIRNVDNIVAKRGALYMIELKHALQDKGWQVVHIKTDSIKIANVVPDSSEAEEVLSFIETHGKLHGYDFDFEAQYEKFCLVNDAVYVARYDNHWHTVGVQFAHPYVYKSLFSYEELTFDDFCETKNVVQGTMYLDKERSEEPDYRRMRHVGRTGRFVPVLDHGGVLYRVKDDKYYAVSGTKGYLWIDADIARDRDDLKIDMSYFEKLKDEAIKSIERFGSFEEFVN